MNAPVTKVPVMKASFIVGVEGAWLENGKPATASMAEKRLREAAKDGFDFLADRVTVRKINESEKQDDKPARPAPAEEFKALNDNAIEYIMDAVQCFAREWSLIGSGHDQGDMPEQAKETKQRIRNMLTCTAWPIAASAHTIPSALYSAILAIPCNPRMNDGGREVYELAHRHALDAAAELAAAAATAGFVDAVDAERWRAVRDVHDELLGAAGIPCVAIPAGPKAGRYANGQDADDAVDSMVLFRKTQGVVLALGAA